MKTIKLLAVLILVALQAKAQTFADKKFYIVDSVDVSVLDSEDKLLLDSCLKVYQGTTNDTVRINALFGICENMVDETWHKYQYYLLEYVLKCMAQNQNSGYEKFLKKSLATSYINIGYIHDMKGEMLQALEFYSKGLVLYKEIKDLKGLANAYSNMGVIYHYQGQIIKALDYHQKSLKIREKINDKKGLSDNYSNLGYINITFGEPDKALEYYNKCIKIDKEIGNLNGIANSYNNIGLIYSNIGNIPQAIEYIRKSYVMHVELGDKANASSCMSNIGVFYFRAGKPDSAEFYYTKALLLREEVKDKKGIVNSLCNLGKIDLQKGDIKSAEKRGERALKLAKEVNLISQLEWASSLLYQVYYKQGRWKEAFDMKSFNAQMKDSLDNEEIIKATANQQAKYEFDKKITLKDAEQAQKDVLAKEEKQKQQIIIYSISLGLLLVFIFLGLLYQRFKVTQKQKSVIEKQKEEVEQQKGIVEQQKHLVEQKNHEITQSIQYAQKIQSALLPNEEIFRNIFPDSFVIFKPKDIVSGDFYWISNKERYVFYSTADSTGHGVPGGFMSMLGTSLLNEIIDERGIGDCGKILTLMREKIMQALKQAGDSESKDGMDMVLIRIDKQTLEMQYAAANNSMYVVSNKQSAISNEYCLLQTVNCQLYELPCDKMPVGVYHSEVKPFRTHTYQLQKGDTIYTYTDGYADQFGGEKGKKYTYKKLREKLLAISQESLVKQKDILENEFENWKNGQDQIDDVCLIGVKI